jgi:hypothetical protein
MASPTMGLYPITPAFVEEIAATPVSDTAGASPAISALQPDPSQ